MSSKQTCICLTHSVYAKCENGCVHEEATIDYYHVLVAAAYCHGW